MPDHYYEEDKKRTTDMPYEENKYSKYHVENALDTVMKAQEYITNPKMIKYMKMYLAHKKMELDKAEVKLSTVDKVGQKMKKMGL